MKALLKAGASVNAQTVDGCGLLCYARSVEAIEILIEAGVDLNLVDQDGKKSYEYFDDVEMRSLMTPSR